MNSNFYNRYVPPNASSKSNGSNPTPETENVRRKRSRDEAQSERPKSAKKTKIKRSSVVFEENTSEAESNAPKSGPGPLLSKTISRRSEGKQEGQIHTNPQTQGSQKSPSPFEDAEETPSKKGRKEKPRNETVDKQSDKATSGDSAMRNADLEKDDSARTSLAEKTGEVLSKATGRSKIKRRPKTDQDSNREHDEDQGGGGHRKIRTRFRKALETNIKSDPDDETSFEEHIEQEIETHSLIPLPQPPPGPDPEKPTFSGLPLWLAKPVRVSLEDKRPFETLHLHSKLLSNLKGKGYTDAFAVQAAVIPLLLDGPERQKCDICISAPTGSGKTLAYVLPMIEHLRTRIVTKLRGLIVVPTRELVKQVREVCELCASGTTLHIGTAVGSKSLKEEQEMLMKKSQRYDPAKYQNQRRRPISEEDWSAFDLQTLFSSIKDEEDILPDHILEYISNVDILICTPGRLVDHLRSTRGFSLDAVQWLVIDEADRLVNESFQEWVGVVMGALRAQKAYADLKPVEQLLVDMKFPPLKREIQKVICSATMTRDLSKLASLDLKLPKMVVLGDPAPFGPDIEELPSLDDAGNYSLPPTLKEFAITVNDEPQKPLYLLELLLGRINILGDLSLQAPPKATMSSSSSSDFESGSDSSSDANSPSISSFNSEDGSSELVSKAMHQPPKPTVLIFTSSTAASHRLSHLLSSLSADLSKHLTTLTKSKPSRRALASLISPTSPIRIAIATDRASRGLDIPFLSHVVSYDVPTSLTAYVHRVGRTARAGREGNAWNLISWREGKWWWGEIGNASSVKRPKKVKRMKLELDLDEQRRKEYEMALKKLEDDVKGFGRRRGSK